MSLDAPLTATIILALQLIAVCWFDWRSLRIPNALNATILLTGTATAAALFAAPLGASLFKAACVWLSFFILAKAFENLRGRQGLGGGDIKFLAAASTWINLETLPWAVLIASLSALALIGAKAMVSGAATAAQRHAFGPHLSLGLFSTWLAFAGAPTT
ncbi:MAG: prepilin peptidase [Alphaproteobacteria bacterium]|nr:prepilin peptidase [Alphaproteobacteria bacterium]